jgi:YihY family inner membrane protein
VNETLEKSREQPTTGGTLALWFGLVFALVALTTAMGQVERGANRIYGIQRDRPFPRKYGRAFVMALCAGLPAVLGFVVLLAGAEVSRAVDAVYDVDARVVEGLRWPVGVLLVMLSYTVVFKKAPRRYQPGYSWLAFGSAVSLLLWLTFTALLVLYVSKSSTFGSIYGPITGVMALLLWALFTSVALFLGIAFAAQLEAVRGGVRGGAGPDPELGTSFPDPSQPGLGVSEVGVGGAGSRGRHTSVGPRV